MYSHDYVIVQGSVTGLDPEVFKQMQMMAALIQLQQQGKPATEAAGTASPLPKAKIGWEKILADTKASIIAKESPMVLKLCRANRDRVKAEAKTTSGASRVLMGGAGGVEILLPGVAAVTVTRTSATDDSTWSGLNGFFRLFSMMAAMTEEEFPRAGLADFLGMWSDLWDYSRGTRLGKIKAATAFYDAHADALGKGTWDTTFKSDSLFLFEHLEGANPALCGACGGSGEQTGHDHVRSPNKNRNTNGGGRGNTNGRAGTQDKNATGTKRKSAWPCLTMLKPTATCDRAVCPFNHPACVSCGLDCKSASVCVDWQQAKVDAEWGAAISKMESTKRGKRRG